MANVHILLNDSGATLISQIYTHPSTRFGLILGTGVNVAGYLPTHLISKDKFGQRPEGWLEEAHSVIVNAELSMFGHGILPRTQWDAKLSSSLPRPEFQPLETMVSGMYLGEIARLVLVDAIEATGLFGGATPKAFQQPYSLGTEVLSMIEENDFTMFETALAGSSAHTMTTPDRSFLRSLAGVISQRSAAIVAVSIHAMWELRQEALEEQTVAPYRTGKADLELEQTIVAFTGSVIESYPGYLDKCQRLVDDLVADGSGDQVDRSRRVRFVPAKESSLLGAGVALAAAIEN
ncbi:N-acetylglucosamine kinase 1 [Fusarium falciforme]|nr:N-acetylglucosamine kinase 1 [Fusarium falciforme]